MELTLDAEASVGGYWSDGTANVEITATLHNEGDLGLDEAVRLTVACRHDSTVVNSCDQETSVSLPDGFGPVTETLTMRSPAGKVGFEIDFGGEKFQILPVDVPKRIVGVNRDVWECFSDTSKVNTIRWDEGVGCAAWMHETVRKWGKESPVKVWLNGPDGFAAEFKDVLTDLSPIVNLRFEWVDAERDAEISAYIGLTLSEVQSIGLECYSIESLGCVNSRANSRSGEVLGDEVIVYNLWPDKGVDFGDFDEWHRSWFKSAMLHEAIHLFTRMLHRTETLSIMNREVHRRSELTPMDEALLKLHGHVMVKPGMTMAEIERLIVFNDELVDPQPLDPRFQAWALVLNAYRYLRDATSAGFKIRSSFPGCSEEFGWANYEVGNLTSNHPYFSWVRIDNGDDHFYVLQPNSDEFEYWRQAQSEWGQVSPSVFSDAIPGWRGDLSDPHHMLESILYYADWDNAEVAIDSIGRATLRFYLDMTNGDSRSPAESVEVVVVIDEGTYELLGYNMDWKLDDGGCDTYQIEARDAQLDIDFTFPDTVRLGSDLIDNCEVESLGSLPGSLKRQGRWARECRADRNADGYARPFQFSLDSWSFVRLELRSITRRSININLLKDEGSGDSSIVDPSASGHYFLEHAEPGTQKSWSHVPLAPGSYTVETVIDDRVSPGDFTLRIYTQPTPPPPYRFKSVSTGDWRTCGLLLDGTPLCWGGANAPGEGAETPSGKFTAISTSNHTCAIREDGTPICWDFEKEGAHTCEPREDGSIFCKKDAQPPPASPHVSTEDDTALASVTIGVIAGYTVQTPPAGEKLTSISTEGLHSCGLREDGTAVCWGSNRDGEGSPPSGERFIAITAGSQHTCGLREDSTAVCWGQDQYYGLLSVPEGERFVAITAGAELTCGLREDGSTVCWGDGHLNLCTPDGDGWTSCLIAGRGEDFLPSPPEDERLTSFSSGRPNCGLRADGTPVCWPTYPYQSGLSPAPEDERFTSISSSDKHACGLHKDGTVVCWGENSVGQSSPPSGVNLNVAKTWQAPAGLTSVSAGYGHTCALDSDGYAICWGFPWWKDRFTERLTSISSGPFHVCGLHSDGTTVCRGDNSEGQSSPPPGEVFVSITSGWSHSCGLRTDGTAICWGSDLSGQSSPPESEVFASISSGDSHVCGLRPNGTAVCWGESYYGQTSPPPGEVFVSITSGGSHSCALRDNGSVVCWGGNAYGQASPPAEEVFVSIGGGMYHVCGIREDGSALCWGASASGQAVAPPDERFVSINCGSSHTCAIRADGTVVCWGDNHFGQATPRR